MCANIRVVPNSENLAELAESANRLKIPSYLKDDQAARKLNKHIAPADENPSGLFIWSIPATQRNKSLNGLRGENTGTRYTRVMTDSA